MFSLRHLKCFCFVVVVVVVAVGFFFFLIEDRANVTELWIGEF